MVRSTRMSELLFSVLPKEREQKTVITCACCCNVVLGECVTSLHLVLFDGDWLATDLGFLAY